MNNTAHPEMQIAAIHFAMFVLSPVFGIDFTWLEPVVPVLEVVPDAGGLLSGFTGVFVMVAAGVLVGTAVGVFVGSGVGVFSGTGVGVSTGS